MPERADAARSLALVRGQWHMENQSHWVRDVTFDEDRSQVRCGSIPQVMAALRNTVRGLLRCAGHTNMAAACHRFATQPRAALHLIGIAVENCMALGTRPLTACAGLGYTRGTFSRRHPLQEKARLCHRRTPRVRPTPCAQT